jgi:hypothetical protein
MLSPSCKRPTFRFTLTTYIVHLEFGAMEANTFEDFLDFGQKALKLLKLVMP